MTQVEELQARIRNLPTEDFSKLREWFFQLEHELWDQQISMDFKASDYPQLSNLLILIDSPKLGV
jgi:hypothetical protein